MSNGESAKQRASRIPLQYYKKPDRLLKGKFVLVLVAVAMTVGWFALDAASNRVPLRVSRGPLAAAHATFESQCERCHVPFQPIVSQPWITNAMDFDPRAADKNCIQCHAGGAHSPHERQPDVPTCATCHTDHKGRDASLVRTSDSHCTKCHSEIALNRKEDIAAAPEILNVTDFSAEGHPEWALLREGAKDPGELKFNHSLHMTPGLPQVEGGKPLYKVKQLSATDRARFGVSGDDDDPVQLQCASCHSVAPRSTTTNVASRTAGDYMAPIRYDNHCAACHPLTFDTAAPASQAPHGKQPEELNDWLWNYFAGKALKEDGAVSKAIDLSRRPDKPADPKTLAVRQEIEDRVTSAATLLFDQKRACGECHEIDNSDPAAPLLTPTNVPVVWFEKAWFDHAPHRAVKCGECHQGAEPGPNASTVHTDVLLPGIETCLQCHAPKSTKSGQTAGGARYDCAECHWYHQAEGPGHNVGSPAQDVRKRLDIDEFLKGR